MGLKQTIVRFGGVIRWVSVALIALGFLLTVRAFPIDNAVAALKGWADRMGAMGPVVFGIIYVLMSLLLLPATVLMFAAGAIFGFTVGVIVVSISATVAAAIAFLIARYAARRHIEGWVRRTQRFHAIDRAIGAGGVKMVALLRLSPIVPYTISNYVFGLTSVRFWPYLLATWLFMLPGTAVYVFVGDFGAAGLTLPATGGGVRSPGEWALLIVGLAATAAATVYVTRLARAQLRELAHVEPDVVLPEFDEEEERSGWPWTTIVLASLACLWLLAAGLVSRNGEAIRQFFAATFEPLG